MISPGRMPPPGGKGSSWQAEVCGAWGRHCPWRLGLRGAAGACPVRAKRAAMGRRPAASGRRTGTGGARCLRTVAPPGLEQAEARGPTWQRVRRPPVRWSSRWSADRPERRPRSGFQQPIRLTARSVPRLRPARPFHRCRRPAPAWQQPRSGPGGGQGLGHGAHSFAGEPVTPRRLVHRARRVTDRDQGRHARPMRREPGKPRAAGGMRGRTHDRCGLPHLCPDSTTLCEGGSEVCASRFVATGRCPASGCAAEGSGNLRVAYAIANVRLVAGTPAPIISPAHAPGGARRRMAIHHAGQPWGRRGFTGEQGL